MASPPSCVTRPSGGGSGERSGTSWLACGRRRRPDRGVQLVAVWAVICQRSPPQLSVPPVCLPLYTQTLSANVRTMGERGPHGACSAWRCHVSPSAEYHTSLNALVG